MTEKITCFTIVARNYLGYALTLGQSLAKANPDYEFHIVVVDGLSGVAVENIPFSIINAPDICDEDFMDMAFRYNVVEFATSIKPQVFRYFLKANGGTIFYLDPDLYINHSLAVIAQEISNRSICVTPHLLQCKLVDEPYPEYLHLFEGVFNFGFCGVRESPDAELFLNWWDHQLRNHCYIDHADGLHTDQKWANYLPCYFGSSLVILRHPGANVAHWNLGERSIAQSDGDFSVNHEQLLFFHFSGFDYFGTGLVKRGKVQTSVKTEEIALLQLAGTYRSLLKANDHEYYASLPYALDFYPNGDLVTHLHRRFYRMHGLKMKNPFVEFHSLVAGARLIDKSKIAAAGYRRNSISTVDAKISRFFFPLKLILRVLGIKRYTILIKAFKHFGRVENHEFLLKD